MSRAAKEQAEGFDPQTFYDPDAAWHARSPTDWGPHCTFGRMSPREWGKLLQIHVDYHLRQFAA
jgi:hypothetical protein